MIEPFEGIYPEIPDSVFVHEAATVIGRVILGEETSVWPSAVLRGDDGPISVGARTSIQDGAVLHMTQGISETVVGDRVTVGHNVTLHGCRVEDDCIIGMGAIVLDNAVVESGAYVGAGALVPMGKTVPAGTLVMGNPFKVVREVSELERQWIELSWRSYVDKARLMLRARGRLTPPSG